MQRCSKCQKVYYCSRECQTKDWKSHKASCSAVVEAKSASVTVKVSSPDLSTMLNTMNLGAQALKNSNPIGTASNAKLGRGPNASSSSGTPKPPKYGERFIVKAQVQLDLTWEGTAPVRRPKMTEDDDDMIVIYNEDRTYQTHIKRSDGPREYKTLFDKILKDGVSGQKAYMWATVDESTPDKVTLNVGELAKIQKW